MDNSDVLTLIPSHNENAPWVVFLNGLFADYSAWQKCYEPLRSSYRILLYNNLGQGSLANLTQPVTLQEQVDHLDSILEKHDIDKAHFIGISNGARIGLSMAQHLPQRVHQLFIADTYAKLSSGLKAKLESWLFASQQGGNELRFRTSSPWIFGETIINEHPELLDHFLNLAKDANQENSENLIYSAINSEDIDVEKITVPVHYFVGEEDFLTPVLTHNQMHSKTPNSTLSIIKGGHASLYEYPENFTNFILPKLNENIL